MKLRNKIISLVLVLLMLVPYTGTVVLAVESSNSISISNVEEFIEFTNNCSLDSWSKGKTVTLTANIDLSGYEDVTVPTFGGTFDGGGFTISGVTLTDSGSDQGLFRYIQSTGNVKELTVEATITGENNIGGIAGSNAGTIQKCTFNGSVTGKTAVGGIAGINEETGKIIETTTKGTVNGASKVGGVAGVNYGTMTKCANLSKVGTEPQVGGSFDIGGIAGYSIGNIESCTNTGDVGALHTGYNIGGVVGRQEGLVNGAANTGDVNGRKDVGGIVGQLEPTINIVFTDDVLKELNTELTNLYSLIDDTLDDSDYLTTNIQKRLKNASSYIDTASTSANSLLSQLSGTVGGGGNLTSSASLIYASLGNYSAVLQDMKSAVGEMTDGVELIIQAIRSMNSISGTGASSISKALTGANELHDAMEDMEEAVSDIESEISSLRNAVLQANETKMEDALENLILHVESLGDSFADSADKVAAIKTNLAGLMSSDSTNQKKVRDEIDDLVEALDALAESADDVAEAMGEIEAAVEPDWNKLQKSLKTMAEGVEDMGTAAGKAETALKDAAKALKAFTPALTALDEPMEKITNASETGEDGFADIETVLNKIESYLTDLAKADPEDATTSLGSSFTSQSQTLYRAIVSLSSEITGLSTDIANGNKTHAKSVEGLNEQLQKVMALVVKAIEETGTKAGTVTDISDDKVSEAKTGKLLACTNSGYVMGDRDVGGVVGTMAIENSLDHEDQQSDALSAENQYEIMAIVTGCLNEGEVVGTKEAVGGIAGRMELGTVIDCENYGIINGSGNYTGGIAGISNASVRRSYSKSVINGESFVGGIVGKGNRIDACYAIVVIDGAEKVGAIAGWGDTAGELVTDNYYLDNGVPAIDGVSYHEIAEPIAINSLQSRTGLPSGFATFKITCMNGDEVVETVTVQYGAELSEVIMPDVPAIEGLYGYWSDFTMDLMLIDQTVYAEYGDYITVISSEELDEGRAFALAEGQFTKDAELHVYESAEELPFTNAWGVWDISISDTGINEETITTVKLLNQTGEFASIWQLIDGEWVKCDTSRDGSYLVINMTGNAGTFCFRPDYIVLVIIIAILVVAVVGIIVVIILMIKNHKKKSGKKKARRPKQEKTARQVKEKKVKKAKKEKKPNKPEVTSSAPSEIIPEFHIPVDRTIPEKVKQAKVEKEPEKPETTRADVNEIVPEFHIPVDRTIPEKVKQAKVEKEPKKPEITRADVNEIVPEFHIPVDRMIPEKVKQAKVEKEPEKPEITRADVNEIVPEFHIPEDRPVPEKDKMPKKEKKVKEPKKQKKAKEKTANAELHDFNIPDEKPQKLSLKEKQAIKRREKTEKRRIQRALERNREVE